jgi:hypothetical protein
MTVTQMYTGPIRIDPLAGHDPTWRPDHDQEPIYLEVLAELGPPGMLTGPGPIVGEIVTEGLPLGGSGQLDPQLEPVSVTVIATPDAVMGDVS